MILLIIQIWLSGYVLCDKLSKHSVLLSYTDLVESLLFFLMSLVSRNLQFHNI